MSMSNLRIGHGYDVHRYAETYDDNKPLILGGCKISEKRSLVAHSDGDVILHALCDALLGALAAGDIGQHFPDNDDTYANADSSKLLVSVLQLVRDKNFELVNVDITVIAQVPKLAGYRRQMLDRLTELLDTESGRVNIKATTTEGLGFIGREEGIACHCVTLLRTHG